MTTQQTKFENRHRTSRAIFGWVVVSFWMLAAIFALIAVFQNAMTADEYGAKDTKIMSIPALVFGILAIASPIGYFIVRAEANCIEELSSQFRNGRQLAKWTVSPDVAKRYRAYVASQKKKVAKISSGKVEVFVGQGGAYIDGEFVLWGTAGRQLAAVTIVKPPATGLMLLEITVAINGYAQVTWAPLPPGSEPAANRLRAALLQGNPGGWATNLSTAGMGLLELFR